MSLDTGLPNEVPMPNTTTPNFMTGGKGEVIVNVSSTMQTPAANTITSLNVWFKDVPIPTAETGFGIKPGWQRWIGHVGFVLNLNIPASRRKPLFVDSQH